MKLVLFDISMAEKKGGAQAGKVCCQDRREPQDPINRFNKRNGTHTRPQPKPTQNKPTSLCTIHLHHCSVWSVWL